jgi:large subunit ribosomal protein L37Ae
MTRSTKKQYTASLGARYGRTVRKRLAQVEEYKRIKYPCQSCGGKSVKRISVGIWKCRKCGYAFTGGAYSPTTKIGEMSHRIAKRHIF